MQWLIERVSDANTGIGAQVVVATPADAANDPIEALCKRLGVPCHRKESNRDVVGEMDAVVRHYNPKWVMRILGDCPFLEPMVVRRAIKYLRKYDRDLMVYYLPSWVWPVYGSREFPISRRAWDAIARSASGPEREHPDLWLHRHRSKFSILYHQGPTNWFYADRDRIRLEIDYPEDLDMVRAIAEKGPGMLAPLVNLQKHQGDIMYWLGRNEKYCRNAKLYKDKTGPTVSYENIETGEWRDLMTRADFVLTWEGQELRPPDMSRAVQVFCDSGQCLLGWGSDGVLHRVLPAIDQGLGMDIINHAGRLVCKCGAGGRWWRKVER